VADREHYRYRRSNGGLTLMYRPFKTQRRPIGSLLTGAIICVVLGFLLGIVYLAILGRYGVPFWVAGLTY
jgi:hypothetical protein